MHAAGRDRQINRRQQGDLGEASAIEWLTSVGATVLLPFGHSPDYDLVGEAHGRLLRVQVKTSTQLRLTATGQTRYAVALATCGGNQSWNGVPKPLDPCRVDYLFALTGEGRRWFIPSTMLEAVRAITLDGPKYSEFEIDPGRPIRDLVYEEPTLKSGVDPGEYPSGQRMAAVNRPAQPSQVRILPPPSAAEQRIDRPSFERSTARRGKTILGAKRRLGIPVGPCEDAGL